MILFQELIPCFHDDPVQIYMRQKLGYEANSGNATPSSASKALGLWYHINNFKLMENKPIHDFSTVDGIIYPIFTDPETNIIVTGDIILSKSVIKKTFNIEVSHEGTDLCCVFFHSNTPTPYQQYKAMACLYALLNSTFIHNIDKTRLVLYSPSKNKSEIVDVKKFLPLRKKLLEYVEWYKQVQNINHSVDTHPFLYPNMKYMEEMGDKGIEWKTKWAYKINEITLLPSIKPSHRNICNDFELIWKDPSLLDKMQLYPKGINETIKPMLKLHFDSSPSDVFVGNPELFKQQCLDWHRRKCCLFIDFETIGNQIYMIGIGRYDISNGFQYECLISKSLSSIDLQELMDRFVAYLDAMILSIDKIFYWYAEITFLRNADLNIGDVLEKYNWVDICSIFRKTPVLVRHCFNFKLKNIWKCMKEKNLIQTEQPPDDCCNGQQSIEIAKQFYSSHSDKLLQTLKSYNQFDCQVMYDILYYFKSNQN